VAVDVIFGKDRGPGGKAASRIRDWSSRSGESTRYGTGNVSPTWQIEGSACRDEDFENATVREPAISQQ
jgi:hypothetical protein